MASNTFELIIFNCCLNVFCARCILRVVCFMICCIHVSNLGYFKYKQEQILSITDNERLCFCTSDWANSLSWWGNRRSNPPPWMSMDSPKIEPAMAEHSICQPGLPCYNIQKNKNNITSITSKSSSFSSLWNKPPSIIPPWKLCY